MELSVREFYDTFGWVRSGEASGEDLSFRQFHPAYYDYHRGVEARTLGTFDGIEGTLLIAGCGDMPDSHVTLAQGFDAVSCIDISRQALDIAATRLGPEASLVEGSILAMPFPDGAFDAVFCAHVIYHIDIAQQRQAISELLRVTRPGGRVVVVYANPRSPFRYVVSVLHRLGGLRDRLRSRPAPPGGRPPLYFARHPLSWWSGFADKAAIRFQPWDVIGSHDDRILLRSDATARRFYSAAQRFEQRYPQTAVRLWQYPIVILDRLKDC